MNYSPACLCLSVNICVRICGNVCVPREKERERKCVREKDDLCGLGGCWTARQWARRFVFARKTFAQAGRKDMTVYGRVRGVMNLSLPPWKITDEISLISSFSPRQQWGYMPNKLRLLLSKMPKSADFNLDADNLKKSSKGKWWNEGIFRVNLSNDRA